MSTPLKRRAYKRLLVAVDTPGFLVFDTTLGVVDDKEAAVSGFVIGIVMMLLGGSL